MFGRLLLRETVGVVVNEHNKLRINLRENPYDIIIEHGLLSNLGALISQKSVKPKTFIVTDNNISVHWLKQTVESLSAQGLSPKVLEVSVGESTKSFIHLEKIIDQLLESKVDRDSLLVALGGGVIGDLAGFAGAVTLIGLMGY